MFCGENVKGCWLLSFFLFETEITEEVEKSFYELASVAPWTSLDLRGGSCDDKWLVCENERSENKWTGKNIGNNGAEMIGEALKYSSTLTELDLSSDELCRILNSGGFWGCDVFIHFYDRELHWNTWGVCDR